MKVCLAHSPKRWKYQKTTQYNIKPAKTTSANKIDIRKQCKLKNVKKFTDILLKNQSAQRQS